MTDIIAAKRGISRSALFQQLGIDCVKAEFPNMTTEQIMGPDQFTGREKLTPAQRIALAKREMARVDAAAKAKKAKARK